MSNAIHRMGKVNFIQYKAPSSSKSANLVTKPRRSRKKTKKDVVASSFKRAYRMMQPSKEIRFSTDDTSFVTGTSVATRTNYVVLDSIAQGTQLNQRIGPAIHVSYVHLKGTIQSNDTKTKFCRIMLFREINYNGVNTTTFADIWRGAGTTTYAPLGYQNDGRWPLNRSLVYKIFDTTRKVPAETEGACKLDYKIRVNRKAYFGDNESGSAQPVHGRLLLLMCLFEGDNQSDNTVSSICAYTCRVFFKDTNVKRH